MSVFKAILVPLDGSAASARSLGCAAWLATRLQAQLHVLSAVPDVVPAKEVLARLKVPKHTWPLITVHQGSRGAEVEILEAVERYAIDLIAMTARGAASLSCEQNASSAHIAGHVTRAVIEQSPVPVLLFPVCYQEVLPWRTILVPMSGEAGTDASLTVAIGLANSLDLKVSIIHVTGAEAEETGSVSMGPYCDAPHHEHPHRFNELVSRACPLCSNAERACIEEFSLARGDVATEIFRLAKEREFSLIVAGWHGRFVGEHARVLKSLCGTVTVPVLLVRPSEKATFKLKVAEEFEP